MEMHERELDLSAESDVASPVVEMAEPTPGRDGVPVRCEFHSVQEICQRYNYLSCRVRCKALYKLLQDNYVDFLHTHAALG
jgi:hypothetical protein